MLTRETNQTLDDGVVATAPSREGGRDFGGGVIRCPEVIGEGSPITFRLLAARQPRQAALGLRPVAGHRGRAGQREAGDGREDFEDVAIRKRRPGLRVADLPPSVRLLHRKEKIPELLGLRTFAGRGVRPDGGAGGLDAVRFEGAEPTADGFGKPAPFDPIGIQELESLGDHAPVRGRVAAKERDQGIRRLPHVRIQRLAAEGNRPVGMLLRRQPLARARYGHRLLVDEAVARAAVHEQGAERERETGANVHRPLRRTVRGSIRSQTRSVAPRAGAGSA